MSNFETSYQPLATYNDNEEETPQEEGVMIHVVPESSKSRWNHIDDLDSFFSRVYHYHQKHGFLCMMVEEILDLVRFVFVVLFTVFLLRVVDYAVIFGNKLPSGTTNATAHTKVTFSDTILPMSVVMANFPGWLIVCLIITSIFLILRIVKVVHHFFHFLEIKNFYTSALNISARDLNNMNWYEVQRKMQEIQCEQQMCIHKAELTELDIYHRILRFKNYMVSLVNKNLLPIKHTVACLGDLVYFTKGLEYNFELLLFYGPWAPFENSWHLKEDYKKLSKRNELANELSKHILWIGLVNLVLSPLIFFWQILYFFFSYAGKIKREPGTLGTRRWSVYGKLYLRHFNELDHELNARLNRAHRLSTGYMNTFASFMLVIICKFGLFIFGSLLVALIGLAMWDEDVLTVEHMLTTMSALGALLVICSTFIPNEHQVSCPEQRLTAILAHIHYMPEHWKGKAHTTQVRDEFTQHFQYKSTHLLEELLSPLITPYILIFHFRHKALDIVDFFRNFTVDVVGVGDVCSFAQMDLKKHGNPLFLPDKLSDASHYGMAEDSKAELSLLHFTTTNPEYRLPQDANAFMEHLRNHTAHDLEMMQTHREHNSLSCSLDSLGIGYPQLMSSSHRPMYSNQDRSGMGSSFQPGPVLRGDISQSDGPIYGNSNAILNSVHQAMSESTSASNPMMSSFDQRGADCIFTQDMNISTRHMDPGTVELSTQEMSFNALYLREMRHRRSNFKVFSDNANVSRPVVHNLWHRPSAETSVGGGGASAMPSIRESLNEGDEQTQTEMQPLLDPKFSRSS